MDETPFPFSVFQKGIGINWTLDDGLYFGKTGPSFAKDWTILKKFRTNFEKTVKYGRPIGPFFLAW